MTGLELQDSETVPLVSVVVPTYRRERMLQLCLQSLLVQGYPQFEILVIDQGPQKKVLEVCAAETADERTIYVNLPNAGLSLAKNHAVEMARGKLCLFIDDDARARPGWIEAYVDLFRHNPQAGLATGRNLGDWEEPLPDWFPVEYTYLVGHYELEQSDGLMPGGHLPVGCNMGGPTQLIRAAGAFDERFGYNRFRKRPLLAGEDSLLSLRIQRAGWELHYTARATIDHSISARKVSARQFCKRNFWQGVTSIELEAALGRPADKGAYLRSELSEIAMATARYLLPQYEKRYALTSPQIRMLSMRRAAHAAGVLYGALFSTIDPETPQIEAPAPRLTQQRSA